jgi:lactoylglutathione lyase
VIEEKCQVLQEVEDEPFSKHAIIEDPGGHLVSLAELKSKGEEEEA